MDEAEDSKCQTMKDTRKRRTFSNDQVVEINMLLLQQKKPPKPEAS